MKPKKIEWEVRIPLGFSKLTQTSLSLAFLHVD